MAPPLDNPQQNVTATSTPNSSRGHAQRLPPAWIDQLFGRFALIWPRDWAAQVERVGAPDLLRNEWAEGLAGLTGEQIKAGIATCRNTLTWPPSIAEFRTACRGGATAEQLAFAARAAAEVPALPSGTRAEQLARGAAQAVQLKRVVGAQRPTRTLHTIATGQWTREHEADFARHAAVLGIKLVPVEWPSDGA